MKRVRTLALLCAGLPVALAAQAAVVSQTGGGATTVSGVYTVSFRLNIASTLPAGTTITCRARIVPGQGELNLRNPQYASAREETASGVAAATGPAANCTAEIPFSWTVASTRGGVMLSYEIDAVSSAGYAPLVVRSSAQQNIQVAFPAPGGIVSLNFHVTF